MVVWLLGVGGLVVVLMYFVVSSAGGVGMGGVMLYLVLKLTI